jgi:cobalamin biosynthesis protein CobD/CbiB
MEKPGTYVLGKNYALPAGEDINRASRLILATSLFAVAVLALVVYTVPDIIINNWISG